MSSHRFFQQRFPPLVVGLSLAVLSLAHANEAPRPAEAYANFTADGAWCWFSDPRAITRAGKTYAGWISSEGSVEVGMLDHGSGRIVITTLHAGYERDDHDNPSLFFLRDGRLMAFYSKHTGPAMNSRITRRPGDISEWEPERTLDLGDQSHGRKGITYSNPVRLENETNTTYLFWRGVSFKPTLSTSTNDGQTWSPAQVVVAPQAQDNENRPYVKLTSDGKSRIHLIFTDGHPRKEPLNNVYYACYYDGAFHKADGSRIAGMNELPFTPDQADLVYDATASKVRAWVWDVAFDDQNNPVIVYTRHPEEVDHRYHYASWTQGEWTDTELCAAGRWFPHTAEGEHEREPHYSGGVVLDHSNPSTVYLSRPVDGVREIEQWTTTDAGTTWTSSPITRDSKYDNVRPFAIRNHTLDGPTVLWMNLTKPYRHYTDFHSALKMNRPANTSAKR